MRSVLAVARLICVCWRMRWGRESGASTGAVRGWRRE
jgi:hypothetical protein